MKYCQNCGKQLSDSAKFCPHCGTPVPATAAPHESAAAPIQDQPAAAAPSNQPAAPAADHTEPPRPANAKKRWGIAAQFDAIAAGQKPQSSYFTYLYGFFQLLYHKSYGLFKRTYLPCCIALIIDFGLLSYAFTAVPTADTLSTIAMFLLLPIAIWFVVVSIWVSRYYPQELYKQVGGNADRIPTSILPPVLGGVILLFLAIVALLVGYLLSPVDSSTIDLPEPVTSASEPAEEEVLPEETTPAESSLSNETPAESTLPDFTNAVPSDDDSWIAPADAPWEGAWYSIQNSYLMILDGRPETQTSVELQNDGSYILYSADVRSGIVDTLYELSADQATLTQMDANGNVVDTYRRPTFDEAYSPLPEDFWGIYTHVEGSSSMSDYFSYGGDLVVDAFRFGIAAYQELTDNGDGTYTFNLLYGQEGGYAMVSLGTYEEEPAIAVYDTNGNVTDVYKRIDE